MIHLHKYFEQSSIFVMVLKRNTKLLLDLSFQLDLSESFFRSLKNPQNFISINLQGCTTLTDQLLHKIVSQFPSLKKLLLAYCKNITDQTLYSLSTIPLTHLDISRCPGLSDEGLFNFLHQKNNHLIYLNLIGSEISSNCIQSIRKDFPNIFLLH